MYTMSYDGYFKYAKKNGVIILGTNENVVIGGSLTVQGSINHVSGGISVAVSVLLEEVMVVQENTILL